ncbi:MAG: methyltransferase domain-containing protein [Actinomycetota bacterium]|nr:methyltransferase domain-containing protein [Actinomycetota bacterium]
MTRRGTTTLLPPRAPHTMGDSREMLEARSELLGSGVFAPISDAIGDACGELGAETGRSRVADLGCGTGYYSTRLADTFPGSQMLTADRSPAAVRMATRAVPRSTGVVLDLWRPLPIRDATADLIINVFAPRNPAEFARILRSRGQLVVVVPTSNHLAELRALAPLLHVPSGKDGQVRQAFNAAGLAHVGTERLQYRASVDPAQRDALVGMGPSAHHRSTPDHPTPDGPPEALPSRLDLTVSVDVLSFRHRVE